LHPVAETEGFEPSIQVLPVYSLSRGAPSTSRPRLLWSGKPNQKSAQDTQTTVKKQFSGGVRYFLQLEGLMQDTHGQLQIFLVDHH
jgi:hypothetical protein